MSLIRRVKLKLLDDRLFSNSLYLMVSTFVMSVTGFFFWVINSKFHTPSEIGLATTFISVTTLLTSISMLGLNISIVRFLPKSVKRNDLINTVFSAIMSISFLFSAVFILGMDKFSPPMKELINSPQIIVLFLFFIPLASLNMITDSVFISFGKAVYSLTINSLMSFAKLFLTILFIRFGVFGIISSFVISTLIATIASVLILVCRHGYRFQFKMYSEQIASMWRFSFGNYLSSIIGSITSLLTPILITSRLSPEITAYYYMPSMIVNLLVAIPRSSVSALIAEGSREEESLFILVKKSFLHIYGLLLPACIVIFVFGNFILSVFGKNYSNAGLDYLHLVLIAILLSVPGYVAGAIFSILKKVKIQFTINIVGALISLGLNVYLLPKGLYGLGLASIIHQVVITLIYAYFITLSVKRGEFPTR